MLSQFIPTYFDAERWRASDVQAVLVFIGVGLGCHFLYAWMKSRPKNLPPGPAGLPIVGHLPFLGRFPHRVMKDMTKKYGNIFGLHMGSQYTVILNEYKLMKETLTNPAALDRSTHIFDHLLNSGFISKNGEEWIEQRRFSINSARNLGLGKDSWESLMMEEVLSFVKGLRGHRGAPADIGDELCASVSSNIMSLLIGRRLSGAEKDKVQLCVDYADVSFLYMGPSDAATVMPWLRGYLQRFRIAGYDRAHRIIQGFCRFAADEISRHKTSAELRNVPDFINTYLEKLSDLTSSGKSPPKNYFSEYSLQGNLSIMFLGASDTITSSMGWALRLMAKHQDIQQKVYKELMEVLGTDGLAKYEERHKIPYTFAVCLEIERFGSIVPLSTTRCASKDFEVAGYTIPKGAEITANLWAMHYDPDYWQEPEQFRPERFLTPDETELLKQVPSFAPFSIGRRNCPGETIAWMEILAYFSEIVKKFRISTPPGVEPEFEEINGLVARLKPQHLCFVPREQS